MRKGSRMTPEQCERLSAAQKGHSHPQSQETRDKIAAGLRGIKRSAETRRKVAAAQVGRVITPETRARLSQRLQGHPVTPETRAKIRAGHLGKIIGPAQREKSRLANLGNRAVLDAPVLGVCSYCGAPATTHDHVIPKSRGGSDEPENIVPCCRFCNSRKGRRTVEEWKGTHADS
jgi:5-methylcytosine-specific restriction endonuclease McrA